VGTLGSPGVLFPCRFAPAPHGRRKRPLSTPLLSRPYDWDDLPQNTYCFAPAPLGRRKRPLSTPLLSRPYNWDDLPQNTYC